MLSHTVHHTVYLCTHTSMWGRQALPEAEREQWAGGYARRAIPAYPSVVAFEHLSTAVDVIAKLTPVGSLVSS